MNPSRRSYLATLGGLATAGCTAPALPGGDDTGQRDISLLLNWKPSGLHAPYYAARAQGYYEEEGLSMSEITSGQGSDFAAKQTGLGQVPFAISSADQILNSNSRDLSPRSVGVVMQHNPSIVFTTRTAFDGPLTDTSQLRGRRVGTGPGMVRVMTDLFLKESGVRSSVDLVDSGFNTVQQLLAGEIDAAGGVFADAVVAQTQGSTVDSIRVGPTIPSYGHVVATAREYAQANPEVVRSFLRATARGAAWAHRNPAQAVEHVVEDNQALAESRTQQRLYWEAMTGQYTLSPAVAAQGWGWSSADPWETTAEMLAEADLLGGSVDPDSVWTNAYLDTENQYIREYADIVSG
jgi:NitT/TauT family transport system substrate-binding protein